MADIPVALKLDGLPDGSLMGAMLSMTSGKAAGHNFWIIRAQGDIVVTGQGETEFAALRGHRRRRRGPDRQLGLPGLPDLSPPPGPSRLPGLGPVLRRRPAGVPAAAERHRRPVQPPRCGIGPERPVLREGDRRRIAHGRGRVPVAGRAGTTTSSTRSSPTPTRSSASGSSTTPCTCLRTWRRTILVRCARPRIVNYGGVLEQALRDLAAWVEKGTRTAGEHHATGWSTARCSCPRRRRSARASNRPSR